MSKGRLILLTAILGLMSTLPPVAVDPFIASMPNIAEGLGTTPSTVALSLATLMAGNAIGQLFHGPLADRYGRKPTAIALLAVYALAALSAAFSPTIEFLLAVRFVQGLAQAGGRIVASAIARDLFERERLSKMLSDIAMVMSLTTIFGPIVGGYIAQYLPWQAAFGFMVLYGVTVMALVILFYSETVARKDTMALSPNILISNFAAVGRNRIFLRYVFCSAFTMGGFSTFLAISAPLLIGYFGVEPRTFGFSLSAILVSFFIGSIVSSRLVVRKGINWVIALGSLFSVSGGISLLILELSGISMPLSVILPMCAYMFGMALIFPQASAGALQPFGAIAGVASSLIGFVQNAMTAVAMTVIGLIPLTSPLPMAIGVAGMALCSLAIYLFSIRPNASSGTAA